MIIIIRQYDVENTSEIPILNKPSLRPRVQETRIESASITIESKEKGEHGETHGVVLDSDGTLVLDEIVSYSKDGSKLVQGYSVSGTLLSNESSLRSVVLRCEMGEK